VLPYFFYGGESIKEKDVIANERVRWREVRLIDENGNQLGIMSSREALDIARNRNLDLVAIAPNANPPVCKIVDLGKYLYEKNKKEKEAKKKQMKVEMKQMRYRLKIDKNDLDTKNKKVRKFLELGNRVKLEIWFRGREMAHTEKGFELAQKIIDALSDVATVSSEPKLSGRNLIFYMEPTKETLKKLKERRDKNEKKDENNEISS
jgi:translation initiation factor IF-3